MLVGKLKKLVKVCAIANNQEGILRYSGTGNSRRPEPFPDLMFMEGWGKRVLAALGEGCS